jgi:hypothetical protein
VRYNSGTPSSVSAIYIEQNERGGEDVSGFLSSLRAGTRIKLFKENSVILFHLYNITTVTDSGDYYTLAVSEHSGSSSNFANNDNIAVGFALMGASGTSGGAGDTSQFLFLNGTRIMTGIFNMGGFNISNMLDPISAQDAATKNYVDAVNTSMRNNVSIYSASTAYVDAVNTSMRNNVSAYVIAVNNSQTANTSAYVIAVNNSMKAYVDAVNTSMRNNVSVYFASTAYVDAVNTSMRNNISINHPTITFLNTVNDTMRNNVSTYVIAVNDSMRNNVSQYVIAVNNTQTLNMSLINATQNVNVSLVNTSMRINVSVNHAALVSGKVPTAQLGGAGADSTKFLRGDQSWQLPGAGAGDGNTYHLMGLSYSPADNGVNYFGATPQAVTTTVNLSPVWMYKAGTVTGVTITSHSGTAGSGETWGAYLLVNGSTEYWLQNITVAGATRVWRNSTVSVPVANGSHIQIRMRNPPWGTNPLTTTFGAYVTVT